MPLRGKTRRPPQEQPDPTRSAPRRSCPQSSRADLRSSWWGKPQPTLDDASKGRPIALMPAADDDRTARNPPLRPRSGRWSPTQSPTSPRSGRRRRRSLSARRKSGRRRPRNSPGFRRRKSRTAAKTVPGVSSSCLRDEKSRSFATSSPRNRGRRDLPPRAVVEAAGDRILRHEEPSKRPEPGSSGARSR